MIRNARQYRITHAQAMKLEQALAQVKAGASHSAVHPRLLQAEQDALTSQLADVREQLGEYDALHTRKRPVLSLKSLDALPRALMQARVGRHDPSATSGPYEYERHRAYCQNPWGVLGTRAPSRYSYQRQTCHRVAACGSDACGPGQAYAPCDRRGY